MRFALLSLLALPGLAFAQDTSPTDVLWYSGNGGQEPGIEFEEFIETTMGGTVVTINTWANITDLSDYRFVVLGRPSVDFSATEVADLAAYVANDRVLAVAGEGSSSAGVAHVNTVSRLLSQIDDGSGTSTNYPGLNLGLSLRDTEVEAPDLNEDNIADCVQVDVNTTSPFLGLTIPLFTQTMGDIEVDGSITGAVPLSARNFTINMVGVSHTMAARNGLVLLTSDFALYRDEACGLGSKQALWENLYELYCDRDADGSIASECGGFDCNDLDPNELGTFTYQDADGDGAGNSQIPSCEDDAVAIGDDCDDTNPNVFPGQDELCDGFDNNCDGLTDEEDENAAGLVDYYLDGDGDGYGRENTTPQTACDPPDDDYVDNDEDCADGDSDVNPGVTEICNNQVDDDCNGEQDETCVTQPPVPTGGGTTTPESCGCQSTPSLSWLGLGVVGLLAARRRR